MKNNLIKTEIDVINNKIGVMRIGDTDYISLTDLARYADREEPRLPIRDWMRNKEVILYLGLWESINNKNFKGGEFDTFKNEAGSNLFKMSPQKWIRETNAIGIISKSGRYDGGTFAHPDIAFEFASWLSPEFKLYLIKEFERLKKNEAYQEKIEWHANRILSKANYIVHTDAIRNYIVPTLTEKQKRFVYASEADVLNVALFGMTAKEWREKNSKDYFIPIVQCLSTYKDIILLDITDLDEEEKHQIALLLIPESMTEKQYKTLEENTDYLSSYQNIFVQGGTSVGDPEIFFDSSFELPINENIPGSTFPDFLKDTLQKYLKNQSLQK